MTLLQGILNPALLDVYVNNLNYVRAQYHPVHNYVIYNYTEKCQYENIWDEVTTQCRGLIVDLETKEVLARPFKKFHNYGTPQAHQIPLDAPVIVSDKLDGSLGILYRQPHENPAQRYAIATRGSFTSDQAVHATAKLWEWLESWNNFKFPSSMTLLWEIIYPANRVVVDYGNSDTLVLLGAVDIRTGNYIDPDDAAEFSCWNGPTAQIFPYNTLAQALEAPTRRNAEGLVVRRGNEQVKIKQEDYVRLHRIVTRLNARTVWEFLKEGKDLRELIEPLPDEFIPWVNDCALLLKTIVSDQEKVLKAMFNSVVSELDPNFSRKDFALAVKNNSSVHPNFHWAMFVLLDDKDILPKLWEQNKPESTWTPIRVIGEDIA